MYISELVRAINHKLADDTRTSNEILQHMDGVIDDINVKLNAKFPTYTDVIKAFLRETTHPNHHPHPHQPYRPIPSPDSLNMDAGFEPTALDFEYTAIPDKYQRSVVIVGTAIKVYEADEEGNPSAVMFRQDYDQQLFYMLRDFSFRIPEKYQEDDQGFVALSDHDIRSPGLRAPGNPFDSDFGFR